MKKILLSGGDSFTLGNELSDSDPDNPTQPSKLSWASLLANDINYDYQCVAKAGCGNHAIARRVMEYCNSSPVDFVAVMWTFPVRHEITIRSDYVTEGKAIELVNDELDKNWINLVLWQGMDYEEKVNQYGEISNDPWFRLKFKEQCDWHKKTGLYDIARNWFTILDETYHFQATLESIIVLQTFLEKNSIPYVFTSATDQVYSVINSDHVLTKVINRDHWVNNVGFFEWAENNNYKLHPMKHPEDRAHRDWIDLFYKDTVEKYKQ